MECYIRPHRSLCVLLFTAAPFLFFCDRASATVLTTTRYLIRGNVGGLAAFPEPYAKVAITWDSATPNQATFVETAFNSNTYLGSTQGYNYVFLARGAVGVNTNGTASLVAGSVSFDQTGLPNVQTASFSYGGSGNEDGFGHFNFLLDNVGSFTHAVNSVTFKIQRDSGNWLSAEDVLAQNNKGYEVAAHMGVFTGTYNSDRGAITTGYAANPEPGTLALGLMSLFGIGSVGFLRRFSSPLAARR